MRWPFRSKYWRNDARISFEVIGNIESRSRGPIQSAQRRERPPRIEALGDEVAIEPAQLALGVDDLPSAQPLPDRRLEQRPVVHAGEDLVQRFPGDGFRDAGALDFHADSRAAAS